MQYIVKNSISFNVDPTTGYNKSWKFWDDVVDCGWETHTFNIFSKFLSKNHSYLDIGAWIGPTALYGSQLAKHCYAFEPDPIALEKFKINLSLNPNIINIDVYPIAIGPTTGKLSMGSNSDVGDSMSNILFNNTSWEIDSLTLEHCFSKFNIQDCNFIKMDIEGGEELVLPQSKDFIKMLQPTLYVALHAGWVDDKESFFEKIEDSLSFYKNIYSSNGQKISIKDIRSLPIFTEILCSNLEWDGS